MWFTVGPGGVDRVEFGQVTDVLVLWDIDHTLIETRGIGRSAFAAAFERVTGYPLNRMPKVTGRTEPDIYDATVALHGLADAPPFDVFAAALADAYRTRRADLERTGRILPGATAALTHLANAVGVQQSVLTGNTRAVARIKLEIFGLDSDLALTVGAYGDDDGHRPALVPIAQARASTKYGTAFDRRNTILVGDSPADIATAVSGGAHIVAVAAGGTPAAELAGADLILEELTDTSALDQFIDLLRCQST